VAELEPFGVLSKAPLSQVKVTFLEVEWIGLQGYVLGSGIPQTFVKASWRNRLQVKDSVLFPVPPRASRYHSVGGRVFEWDPVQQDFQLHYGWAVDRSSIKRLRGKVYGVKYLVFKGDRENPIPIERDPFRLSRDPVQLKQTELDRLQLDSPEAVESIDLSSGSLPVLTPEELRALLENLESEE
jgi:hypothetical protein